MQSLIARFFPLSLLLSLLAMTASAQSAPSVNITPATGEAERAVFTIEIDGLLPDTRYTIEILFDGAVVFSSEENSDQAGHIPSAAPKATCPAPTRFRSCSRAS